MKLLLVSKIDRFARSVYTISKYVEMAAELGHEVAVFGEQSSQAPQLPYTLDVSKFDFAVFVVYESWDFPDMPYLAQVLDGIPKERRIIIDCCGRYNDTIRVEHDFNHLEKMDGHQGWEWVEGFQAVTDRILQPALSPLKPSVQSFLWHGFDPKAVMTHHSSAQAAAEHWKDGGKSRPYSMVYVGHNWQRWSQLKRLLEGMEPLHNELGRVCIAGSDWDKRPDWAEHLGLNGVDVDVNLLQRMSAETKGPIPFDEVIAFTSQGRFAPVIHRPLFNHLGMVTNRTFSTFCSDAVPLLMLPPEVVDEVYGPQARPLIVGDDVGAHMASVLRNTEFYWNAILETRQHLAKHHSFSRRFDELLSILPRKS